ncbi:MAG: type IV toxin-antitoxin system AbiEi family antitoxin domain-containing protein [Nocardioidaceae bacterium]
MLTPLPGLLDSRQPLPIDRPFTTSEAAALGVGRNVLARLVGAALLRRLVRGVYVAAQVPDSLLLRCRALRLVVPEGAVVTDWTACWLFTELLPPNQHLEIPPVSFFRPSGHGRLRNALCDSGERAFRPDDLMELNGLVVTTPLRTALDLGRLAWRDGAISALDALLRHGGFGHPELLGSVERFAHRRGVVQLRELAPLADSRAESSGESVLRLRWLDCSELPRPSPQVPVLRPNGSFYWLDLGVEELRFAAEYDGEEHHTSDEDREHDRKRRTWLREAEGWIIKPVTKDNVFGHRRDVEEILHAGILEARRRLGDYRRPL